MKIYKTSKSGNKIDILYLFLFSVPVIGQIIILLSDITKRNKIPRKDYAKVGV